MMKKTHSSHRRIDQVEDVMQPLLGGQKPSGLWYQIDNSWDEWVSNEMPEWQGGYCVTTELVVDAKLILVISTNEELLAFTEEFGRDGSWSISWASVAQRYSGIEISTYLWDMRLDDRTAWYYGWDVASGCIWNKAAVTILP